MALDRLSNFDQKWQSKKNKGFRSANNQLVEHVEKENFWPWLAFAVIEMTVTYNVNYV